MDLRNIEENKFRKKRELSKMEVEPIKPIKPQHDMAEEFYELNNEAIKFAQMQPPTVDAKNIKKKGSVTLEYLKEVADNPSPKGTLAMNISGKTIDLQDLEEYSINVNPLYLRTILRYADAKTIDYIKGHGSMRNRVRKYKSY